jgi:glycerol-3-phosphate dehydrogenase
MNRNENIKKLTTETFDVCIIGGGATGAGCALEAVRQGYKVALVEKTDFAAETSSKSTKLIHGGVRYLEQAFKNLDFAQLTQVRHGLEERHTVLKNAPHLAHPLALITPVGSWIEGLYFTIGLKIYSWFASNKDTLPKSQWLSKKEALTRIPTLNKKSLHSAVLYYDGQLDDARYCLAIAQTAQEAGATIANHLEVIGFEQAPNGFLQKAILKNIVNGELFELNATTFINATGAGADAIRSLANANLPKRLAPSKGVHIVLPYSLLSSKDALMIPKTKDGRLIFVIPFDYGVLVGTTDTYYNRPIGDEPLLEQAEIDFLIETLQPFLEKKIDRSEIKSGFGGLRPLIAAKGGKASKNLVRDHEIEYDTQSNLISVLGGKWTTYRVMAKDAILQLSKIVSKKKNTSSEEGETLVGAANYQFQDWQILQVNYGFSENTCQHLMKKYGDRANNVALLTKENGALAKQINEKYPYIFAEIVYAVRQEMAMTLRDVLARRMRLEILDWATTLEVIPLVSHYMAQELGWSVTEQTKQEEAYRILVQSFGRGANLA